MYSLKEKFLLAVVTVLVPSLSGFTLNSIDSITTDTPSIDGCECHNDNSSFYCCQPISVFGFSETVCVNVTSMDTQNVLPFTLFVGGEPYISDAYSEKAPQPYCFEYDNHGHVHVCVVFYNTTFTKTQVSGCLKLQVMVQVEIIIPLKCFTLLRPSVLVKREEALVTDHIV